MLQEHEGVASQASRHMPSYYSSLSDLHAQRRLSKHGFVLDELDPQLSALAML